MPLPSWNRVFPPQSVSLSLSSLQFQLSLQSPNRPSGENARAFLLSDRPSSRPLPDAAPVRASSLVSSCGGGRSAYLPRRDVAATASIHRAAASRSDRSLAGARTRASEEVNDLLPGHHPRRRADGRTDGRGRQQWQNRGLESGVRSAAAAAAAIYMHATAAAAAAGAAACLLSACVIELEQNKERRSRVG